MIKTATAFIEAQTKQGADRAVKLLLRRLHPFVRAYARTPDVEMPEHDLVWMDEIGSGPGKTILAAMKTHPELWAEALPEECCIVPRAMLEKIAGADMAAILAGYGASAVQNQSARLLYDERSKSK